MRDAIKGTDRHSSGQRWSIHWSSPQRGWQPADPGSDQLPQVRRWMANHLRAARKCGLVVRKATDRRSGDPLPLRWEVRYPDKWDPWVEHWGIVVKDPMDDLRRAMMDEHARFDRRINTGGRP